MWIRSFLWSIHYGLVFDLQNKELIDKSTLSSSRCQVVKSATSCIKVVSASSQYHQLLGRYPEIVRANGRPSKLCHNTKHHILTSLRLADPLKCEFVQDKKLFLGYIVSSFGIAPSTEKVAAIQSFLEPKSTKKLRQLVGMLSFYRKCIPRAGLKLRLTTYYRATLRVGCP